MTVSPGNQHVIDAPLLTVYAFVQGTGAEEREHREISQAQGLGVSAPSPTAAQC